MTRLIPLALPWTFPIGKRFDDIESVFFPLTVQRFTAKGKMCARFHFAFHPSLYFFRQIQIDKRISPAILISTVIRQLLPIII